LVSNQSQEREDKMTKDDVLVGYRRRLFTLADEIGVRPACWAMGVHHSTYHRLNKQVDRWGLEALNVRERRRPRMPNQIGPRIEQRIIVSQAGFNGDLEARTFRPGERRTSADAKSKEVPRRAAPASDPPGL
jgi:hypothetical protein